MTHHSVAQQQGESHLCCLSAGQSRRNAAASAAHSSLCQTLTWHHMEVCHQNMSALSHVQDQSLQKEKKDVEGGKKAAFCCDECWSDCVWRKRSEGLCSQLG